MDVEIRPLKTTAEFLECERLQRRVWAMPDDRDVIPLHLLLSAQRNGALVLGAFDKRSLVGLLFGYLGLTATGRLKHCSHLMGIAKVKIRPGWDADVVRRVRDRFPDVLLMADANSAYTLADAEMLVALDAFGLLMIEQPLAYDDLLDHAELQRRLKTPICLDESVPSLAAARVALALGSGRIINIKPGRVGGLVAAKEIHDLCRANGMPVWCGGMLETGIGRAHNVALASLPGFTLPGDISASARYFYEDIVEPEFAIGPDGTMAVPAALGIGVRVIPERLESATVRRSVVS